MKYVRATTALLFVSILSSQTPQPVHPGRQSDGSYLLPSGLRIQPAGRQIPLDTFPMSSAVSRDGKYLLVLNGGFDTPSISVFAVDGMRELARVPVADSWLGLCFSPDGSRVYVGGGSKYSVFEFAFSSGQLKLAQQIEIAPKSKPGENDFIGDVAVSPDGNTLYAADLYHDSVAVIDAKTGLVTSRFKTGRRPYRIVLLPDGKSMLVSSWADGSVYWLETKAGAEITRLRVGPHPTDMVLSDRKTSSDVPWHYRLFIAAANTNTVFVAGVSDKNTMEVIGTLDIAGSPGQALGMTPSGLALSADQMRLFVACSDANEVAVADISEEPRLEGFIPTGAYPTAARMLAGGALAILNGGAVPGAETGSMSLIEPLTDESLDAYTKKASSLAAYRDEQAAPAAVPQALQHVIYVIKGNRSYDEVFGKIGKGDSSPAKAKFDESTAPNHYKLAREFVLFDNFYVNGSSSAEGQNWAFAGIAPDYTERMWPNVSANRSRHNHFEGGEPANTPPAGYLWSNALIAGLSVRNYGEFVQNNAQAGPNGIQIARIADPSLGPVTDVLYRGADPAYSDVARVNEFLNELKQFQAIGDLPRLIVIRLENDRAASGFADNDTALGALVEGVSKSPFWPSTAIFIAESDAGGADHVEQHRSVLLMVSPFSRLGAVDSNMYTQSSVLRTIEMILGLRPMTQFDAAARPLTADLRSTAPAAPYQAVRP